MRRLASRSGGSPGRNASISTLGMLIRSSLVGCSSWGTSLTIKIRTIHMQIISVTPGTDLEAFAVDDGGAGLVVLLLGDPHLLEGGERGQDGAADPDGVLPLRGRDDLDLHRAGRQRGDLLLHTVGDARVHGAAARQHSVGVQVLTDVHVALHDAVVGRLVDAAGFHAQEGRLEEGPPGSGSARCRWWWPDRRAARSSSPGCSSWRRWPSPARSRAPRSRASPWCHARFPARRWWWSCSHARWGSSSGSRSGHGQPGPDAGWREAGRNLKASKMIVSITTVDYIKGAKARVKLSAIWTSAVLKFTSMSFAFSSWTVCKICIFITFRKWMR